MTSPDAVTEMDFRPLGSSGLMVSAVGRRVQRLRPTGGPGRRRARSCPRPATTGSPCWTPPTSTAASPGRARRCSGEALQGQRDEFVAGHEVRHGHAGRQRRRLRRPRLAALRPPCRRGEPAPAADRPHRPLPAAPARSADADRGDARRARPTWCARARCSTSACSNFDGWQVADASWTSSTAGLASFVSVQNEYSLLDRSVEDEVTPACERFGLGILPFFPLARGLLTGKYQPRRRRPAGVARRARGRPRRLARARPTGTGSRRSRRSPTERGVELLDVAIGGLAAQPAVASVIAGATSAAQVTRNARAAAVGADRRRPGDARRARRDLARRQLARRQLS